MSVTDQTDAVWGTTLEDVRPHRRPLRRARGLRITAVPGAAAAAQWLGGVAALLGVYLQWGAAVTLILGGAAAVVLGMLREGGKI
jgi:hypothetical protein